MDNSYGKACKVIGGIIIAVGLIMSVILGFSTANILYDLRISSSSFNWGIFIVSLMSTFFLGMVLIGIGEIIRLLDDNAVEINNLSKKEKVREQSDELPDL